MYFISIGDMGNGSKVQYGVAKLMKYLCDTYNVKFISGLGDNIYESGCKNVKDKGFQDKFEKPYSILSNTIRWYMLLGNHDYGYDYGNSKALLDNSIHQILYTKYSKKWYMPSKYYSFTRGPMEFFYLDTNFDILSAHDIDTQLQIMKQKLDTSKKRWKIVCGHHTWRSIAEHGNAEKKLEDFLTSLFKHTKPHLYMCGHDHCKSIMKKKGITLVISGNGGEEYDGPNVNLQNCHDCSLKYFSPSPGVALVNANKKTLTIDFYNKDKLKEYSYKLR
tara:strand:+ start:802 stop:1629 length:828 start_codon:yes stop_codon:yes gene_type:complete